MRFRAGCFALVLASVSLWGCEDGGGSRKGGRIVESTDHPTYAVAYPQHLDRGADSTATRESKAEEQTGKLAQYPEALKDPDWDVTGSVYEAADEDGKSSAYAMEAEAQEQVRTFFDEEREPILKKVGGSAQYAVKQKGCDADVYGAVAKGLTDAIDERMKERLAQRGNAILIIERNEEKLGKANVATLTDQAADIAEASYIVNVELDRKRDEQEQRLAQIGSVRATLRSFIDEEKRLQESMKPEEKRSSDARIAAAEQSLSKLDQSEQRARAALDGLHEKHQKAREDYQEAFDALLRKVRERSREQAAKGGA